MPRQYYILSRICLFLGLAASVHAGRPLEFLFDDDALDRTQGVRRVIGSVTKEPGPIFQFEDPWMKDDVLNHSILYDHEEAKFKMWYTGRLLDPDQSIIVEPVADDEASEYDPVEERVFVMYAESVDGIKWIKPALRRVRFNGSLENNILREWIAPRADPGRDTVFWNVIKDPLDPDPARRYKALGYDTTNRTVLQTKGDNGVCVAFSADGLNWPALPILVADREDLSDCDTVLRERDPVTGKWTMFSRPRTWPKRRFIGYSESDDFVHWTNPEVLLGPEAEDSETSEFYSMRTALIAGWRVGAVWIYPDTDSYATMTSELVYARDPKGYHRAFPRQTWIPLGPPETYEETRVLPSDIIEHGSEIFIYYLGRSRRHGSNRPQPAAQEAAVQNSITGGNVPYGEGKTGIGLARMPWGHFSGLLAETDGMVETKWITVYDGESVKAIANVQELGWIQAELVDQTLNVIPGFDRYSSTVAVDSSDHGKLIFKWKQEGQDPVEYNERTSKLGHVFKIRFYLHRATLFGFQVGTGQSFPPYSDPIEP